MGGPRQPGDARQPEAGHPKAAWQMEPTFIIDMARAWGAALVVSVSPDSLVNCQGWAGTGATCIPASGDGYNEVCRILTDQ
eukprot:2541471-Lingulodinium_polyedra.AAC.1